MDDLRGSHTSHTSRPHLRTMVLLKDMTICAFEPGGSWSAPPLDTQVWHKLEKDLLLHSSAKSIWLYVKREPVRNLKSDSLVIDGVFIGRQPPDATWEARQYGLWLHRRRLASVSIDEAVRNVEVLFGSDAIDPRSGWTLLPTAFELLDSPSDVEARLTVHRGPLRPEVRPRPQLHAKADGAFKIVQISDTHMVTSPGVCRDAIDGDGHLLPPSVADPLTVDFIGKTLDVEKPDLVIFTGDQLHHGVQDSQTALFKVFAPVIERSIPWTMVFGNHDDEGPFVLSRQEQMAILADLPFSICTPGPADVDGVGNQFIKVHGFKPHAESCSPESLDDSIIGALYLLDSHGQIPSKVKDPDYRWITQGQIDWFTAMSQDLKARLNGHRVSQPVSIVFQHIPLPEFGDPSLKLQAGERHEPTEGPSFNSGFYRALVNEGITAVACGHDHVNDFCALSASPEGAEGTRMPWLCYGGSAGFGGYSSYGDKRFHRRMRVWEIDGHKGRLRTWKRVEYRDEPVDEIVLKA